ncbi:MAG TPA: efflux RND transporter permease subunit [Steroidobacteraceae bacterium]|nr:efflux RND transporter permease subunit [Steroidobacteraceae bacterium]
MLKALIDFAIERRVTIVMFTVAIALFGFVSLSRLKLNLLPDLSYPTITIRTELPGAAPLEVETLITRPVEEAVSIIRNVREVRSVSRAGQSDVTLEFLWGTDMDLSGIDVREKLDLLQLPLEARRPLLLRFDPSSEPVLRLALLDEKAQGTDGSVDRLKALRRLAEDRLKPDLEAVEGSAAVKVSGGYEDEVQVFVDQQKLAQLGLSIDVVTRRIRAENVNLSGGRLEQGTQRFLVRTLNEFETVEQMANAIIATRGGQPIYLRDVANVTRGYKDREAITRVNGQEAIELAVYKEGDANTVQLADGVRARVKEIEKNLPEGTSIRQVYDQSTFISAAISEVKSAALIGGVLAILVLYAFLRDARATLISSIAIPVSVLGTFVLMYAFDLTLNIMSLGGIALAVGMLVDNAVVVLESIVRNKEHGHSQLEAARLGTVEVAGAVFAATLTSVAVFAPMVFITGIAGQLFKDQSLTVTFALAFSLLVALTLVPMLAAGRARAAATADPSIPARPPGRVGRGLRHARDGAATLGSWIARSCALALSPLVGVTQRVNQWADRKYPPAIRWALAHPGQTIGGAVALFALTMLLVLPRLGTELIPQMSQGEFNVDLRLPPGTPLEQTDRSVLAAQRASSALGNISLAYSVAGTGNRLDANPVDAGENTGRLSITLAPGSDRADEQAAMAGMRTELEDLPGVQYRFSRPALFSMATPLEVVVAGYDLDRLGDAAERVRAEMLRDPRFADVKTTVEAGNPEIQIVFDQERASQLGLVVRDLADRVVNSVRGEVATRYKLRDKQIDVLVRSVDSRAASIEEVRNLIVNPGSDFPVPLSAVADVHLAVGPAEVRRAGQERVAVVSANLAHGDLGSAVETLQAIVERVELPVGTTAFLSGQSEEMTASFKSLQFVLIAAIFLVYFVMASQFESLIHPFVILLTIPLALIGAVWALWITGTTVNVVAYIGLIMLAGIVVNQSIVLIDAVNQARARGLGKHDAIVEAGRLRLRPILITKLTTILGLLPMALGIGEGAEVRAPMAITVIGGVLLTTFLTLLVIPVVYSVMDRKKFTAVEPRPVLPPGDAAVEAVAG